MLARLCGFLRTALMSDGRGTVPLGEELETLQTYLEIEAVRFGDRLTVEFVAPDALLDLPVPNLLLQPLIENAIKYAVTASESGADIWITARREGESVRIEVADNGDGENAGLTATPSTGVGLANIRDRLAQGYGAGHSFTTRKNERGGFSVIIEIPFESGDKDS